MVNQSRQLDHTFAALSDPTRRALITRLLRDEGLSVSELAEPFAMTLPAVMKHLSYLAAAGLVTRTKQGRVVTYRLEPKRLDSAALWLDRQRQFWSGSLDRLEARASARTRAAKSRKELQP